MTSNIPLSDLESTLTPHMFRQHVPLPAVQPQQRGTQTMCLMVGTEPQLSQTKIKLRPAKSFE
jgi:hypothetical protein